MASQIGEMFGLAVEDELKILGRAAIEAGLALPICRGDENGKHADDESQHGQADEFLFQITHLQSL